MLTTTAAGQRIPPWRDPAYLAWIKQQPCVISGQFASGRMPVDAHHLIGHGYSGVGTKAPDFLAFPLSREAHENLHHYGWERWEAQHGSQWRFVGQTLQRAFYDGVLVFDTDALRAEALA